MNHRTLVAASHLFLLTMCGFPAWALGATAKPVSLLDLPLEQLLALEVSTASKFEQPLTEAPSSVTVITANDIKAFGWRTLAEALASVRGLYVTNDGNYSYLGGRGFARPSDYNARFLFLVDGIRTNDAIYDHASIGREFLIDIDLVERIEYAPGSSSSIYGSNAFFGVINVITKNGSAFSRPYGSIQIGSAGERKAQVSVGVQQQNGAQFLLSATAFRREGRDQYYPAFDAPETNFGVASGLDHEQAGSVFMKASFGRATLSLAHVARERGIPTASFGQSFNDSRSKTKDVQTSLSLDYGTELGQHTRLLSRLFWGQLDYQGAYTYGEPDYVNLDSSEGAWIGTELSILSTALPGHKLLAGIEYQRDYRRDQAVSDEYPPDSLENLEHGGAAQRFSIFNDRRDGNRAGIFLQDEINLGADLLLNVGARYDYNSEISGAASPRLALIYKATPSTTLKAISGRAFRAPSVYEMYYAVPGEGGQKVNPALKSERIRSQEFILEQQLAGDAKFMASVFRNHVTGLISQTEDPLDGMLVFRNLARAKARGVELQYEQAWSDGTRIRMSQSWQRVTDGDTGEQLINSPRSLSKLNVILPFLQNRATAGLEARYVGARRTKSGSLSGFWTANVNLVSAALMEGTELSVSIFNLFDKRYDDPSGEEHTQDSIPQEGRTIHLKVSQSF